MASKTLYIRRSPQGAAGFLLLLVLAVLLLTACGSAARLEGHWVDDTRSLTLGDAVFTIGYPAGGAVSALRGEYRRYRNRLELVFTDWQDSDGTWNSVEGTDLDGHREFLQFRFEKDELVTVAEHSGRTFRYRRLAAP